MASASALPDTPGLTFIEMVRAAVAGRIRAMYVVGENLVVTNPDAMLMERALRALDFLVVQEIFFTETARLAHVVLPAASFAEKSGTFTNTERRIQLLRPVLPPPGEARPDWQIICDVGERIGRRLHRPLRWDYGSPAAIMREIAMLCPAFGGVSYERLERGGLQWPCPAPDHPGTPFLHQGTFTRGKGRFHVTEPAPPFEPTDRDYPLVLSTGRMLFHYNGGAMSRRAAPLQWRAPQAYAEIHPTDAACAGVRDNQECLISSRRGSLRVRAQISDVVPPGMVYMPFHFREAAANILTHVDGLDAGAKTPEYKFCAVRLEPVPDGREAPGGAGETDTGAAAGG
jgi:predicted molibdopterin-dependent oxidoreductase YjgC